AYLARLHNVAGPRPLLVSEAGADSLRHGEERQSALLMMQLRTAFSEGACGAVVFSWTDDWWRGGHQIDDWAFGLVDAKRRPKRSASAWPPSPSCATRTSRSSSSTTVPAMGPAPSRRRMPVCG